MSANGPTDPKNEHSDQDTSFFDDPEYEPGTVDPRLADVLGGIISDEEAGAATRRILNIVLQSDDEKLVLQAYKLLVKDRAAISVQPTLPVKGISAKLLEIQGRVLGRSDDDAEGTQCSIGD